MSCVIVVQCYLLAKILDFTPKGKGHELTLICNCLMAFFQLLLQIVIAPGSLQGPLFIRISLLSLLQLMQRDAWRNCKTTPLRCHRLPRCLHGRWFFWRRGVSVLPSALLPFPRLNSFRYLAGVGSFTSMPFRAVFWQSLVCRSRVFSCVPKWRAKAKTVSFTL